MIDDFCEYIIKRKRDAKDVAMILLAIFGALFLTFVLLFVVSPYLFSNAPSFTSFVFPLVFLVWYGAYRLMKMTYIEFEYAFTAGELDVDKISNRTKRKRLLNVNSRKILDMALVSSGKYSENYKSLKTINASGNNSGRDTYFAVFDKDGSRQCLLFDPPKKMVEMMHRYNPDKISV